MLRNADFEVWYLKRIPKGKIPVQILPPPATITEAHVVRHPALALGQVGFGERNRHIEPQNKEAKVDAQAHACAQRQLLIKTIEAEMRCLGCIGP